MHEGAPLARGVVHTGCCTRGGVHGRCTRGGVQGICTWGFSCTRGGARVLCKGWCARLLHMGTPLARGMVHQSVAQAAVHKRALLQKKWCTSVLHKGWCVRVLHEGWCTSVVQGCCTLGLLLHKQLCTSVPSCTSSGAQVHCTKGRLLHRYGVVHKCVAQGVTSCTGMLHGSVAQGPISCTRAGAAGRCTMTQPLH